MAVTPGRVAHNLYLKLRLEWHALSGARRPRTKDAEQPVLEQQRMRCRIADTGVGAISAVHRCEQRILAGGELPALANG